MPLPMPRKQEKKNAFVSRCMEKVQGEFDSQEQRLAVCYGLWRKKNKEKRGNSK